MQLFNLFVLFSILLIPQYSMSQTKKNLTDSEYNEQVSKTIKDLAQTRNYSRLTTEIEHASLKLESLFIGQPLRKFKYASHLKETFKALETVLIERNGEKPSDILELNKALNATIQASLDFSQVQQVQEAVDMTGPCQELVNKKMNEMSQFASDVPGMSIDPSSFFELTDGENVNATVKPGIRPRLDKATWMVSDGKLQADTEDKRVAFSKQSTSINGIILKAKEYRNRVIDIRSPFDPHIEQVDQQIEKVEAQIKEGKDQAAKDKLQSVKVRLHASKEKLLTAREEAVDAYTEPFAKNKNWQELLKKMDDNSLGKERAGLKGTRFITDPGQLEVKEEQTIVGLNNIRAIVPDFDSESRTEEGKHTMKTFKMVFPDHSSYRMSPDGYPDMNPFTQAKGVMIRMIYDEQGRLSGYTQSNFSGDSKSYEPTEVLTFSHDASARPSCRLASVKEKNINYSGSNLDANQDLCDKIFTSDWLENAMVSPYDEAAKKCFEAKKWSGGIINKHFWQNLSSRLSTLPLRSRVTINSDSFAELKQGACKDIIVEAEQFEYAEPIQVYAKACEKFSPFKTSSRPIKGGPPTGISKKQ
ncbi:MAG TPA: hypothetical protein VNJ01_12575 [Bacteriovoracaceae bacterium]|nr:hypothetical protein [Bacteriovoracaceae bacterium]